MIGSWKGCNEMGMEVYALGNACTQSGVEIDAADKQFNDRRVSCCGYQRFMYIILHCLYSLSVLLHPLRIVV